MMHRGGQVGGIIRLRSRTVLISVAGVANTRTSFNHEMKYIARPSKAYPLNSIVSIITTFDRVGRGYWVYI